jgi:hypothetical protein
LQWKKNQGRFRHVGSDHSLVSQVLLEWLRRAHSGPDPPLLHSPSEASLSSLVCRFPIILCTTWFSLPLLSRKEDLKATYPERSIDSRGPIAWPRSLDLSPMEFFLWQYLKGKRLFSHSKNYRRSRVKISISRDNRRCQHVKACSRDCFAEDFRLPWNGRGLLRKPVVILGR